MSDDDVSPTAEALDALITQLLACGGPLSQMIGHMQAFEASGLSSRDAAPILEVAHALIRDVNADLPKRYSDDEIRVSAEIVEQVTTAICENIFIAPPPEIRRAGGPPTSNGSYGRQRRRSGRRRR